MKLHTRVLTFLSILPLACANDDRDPTDQAIQQAQKRCPASVIRIGVLVDAASPAKANFTAAANLAGTQLNQGFADAHANVTVEVIVREYAAGQAVTQAIDLVNVSNVHALVSDVSGPANGTTGTVAVNRLNYETPLRINHRVPVDCYQCSSAFFNDPAQTDLGFKDPDNWLWRTFFNATFESAVQVQLVLNRPAAGDSNGDGYLKIVVYYDGGHVSAATTMAGILDGLHTGPHSVKLVQKQLPSMPASRAAELAAVFDSAPDGHAPDAVYLAFLPGNAPESLADYSAFMISPKAPATANNGVRRDFLMPTLLASGGEGLNGSSVRVVADSRAGQDFLAAFRAATGGQNPELTASFLYDAVVVHALAALVASSRGQLTPEGLRDALGRISDKSHCAARIGANVHDFKKAAQKIAERRPIDYDGAASSADLTPTGEMYPPLVHWQISSGRFAEFESYQCDPAHPLCAAVP